MIEIESYDYGEHYGYNQPAVPGPNDVVFTQYLRPHGRTREVWITMPEDVKQLADALREQGYLFECEELMSGAASLTVEYPRGHKYYGERPVVMKLVPNGPEVPPAVQTLIRTAHQRVFA